MGRPPLCDRREDVLRSLADDPATALLIIGAGIHGAAFARLAARNGIPCVLIEQADYAGATSSRSSKMLHGGLRYLQNLDFPQTFEGIRAREDLFTTAPHLCRPAEFVVPVRRDQYRYRAMLSAGLTIYDLMGFGSSRRHRYVRPDSPAVSGAIAAGADLAGAYVYTDGLTDDARLVIENVLDARLHGARAINYTEAAAVRRNGDRFAVRCVDRLGGREFDISAALVINCAGPWAPFIGASPGERTASFVRYSAGVHLLFDRPWNGPSLLLRMPGQFSRYYFVWPHAGGTMVGTTERELAGGAPELDPLPTRDEVEEILARLARDLPQSGLDASSLYSGFSGIRTLPVRGHTSGTARLSRRHSWSWREGILTLLGGKLTTANSTVAEGLEHAARHLGISPRLRKLAGVRFPGAADAETYRKLATSLVGAGLDEPAALHIVRRYGARASAFLDSACYLEPITSHLLRGEVELAIREEQAETLEGVLRIRTNVEYLPGALLPALAPVSEMLQRKPAGNSCATDIEAYRGRYRALQARLGRPVD